MTPPTNHFDRTKLFYPLVATYVVQLLGLKELMLRGLLGPRPVSADDITFGRDESAHLNENERSKSLQRLKKILGPLELLSEFQGDRIIVDPDEIAQELVENHLYLLPSYVRAASNLLVLAHEATREHPSRDSGPLWEFLRHCRNAATHNGRFHFLGAEPVRPAEWGQFVLDSSLHGTLLFKNDLGEGMLSPGDPIRLLWDIEQAYPSLSV